MWISAPLHRQGPRSVTEELFGSCICPTQSIFTNTETAMLSRSELRELDPPPPHTLVKRRPKNWLEMVHKESLWPWGRVGTGVPWWKYQQAFQCSADRGSTKPNVCGAIHELIRKYNGLNLTDDGCRGLVFGKMDCSTFIHREIWLNMRYWCFEKYPVAKCRRCKM